MEDYSEVAHELRQLIVDASTALAALARRLPDVSASTMAIHHNTLLVTVERLKTAHAATIPNYAQTSGDRLWRR